MRDEGRPLRLEEGRKEDERLIRLIKVKKLIELIRFIGLIKVKELIELIRLNS